MAGMMPGGCAPRALLDIGTGTGIVPSTFAGIFKTLDAFAGCDLLADLPAKVLRQFGVRVGDRLVLADETAQFFGELHGARRTSDGIEEWSSAWSRRSSAKTKRTTLRLRSGQAPDTKVARRAPRKGLLLKAES